MPVEPTRPTEGELTPESLAPREVADVVACPLPYGLTWSDLVSAMPGVDVRSLGRCTSYRKYVKQGRHQGSDSSCLVTIAYPTVAGPVATRTVFAKETPVGQPEAGHYALLGASGVPTPDLLAAVHCDGREVIVTEFLPKIGVDLGSQNEVQAMLRSIACLNAVPLAAEGSDPPPGRPRSEMDRIRRAGLTVLAQDPRTGVDVDRWFGAFDHLRSSVPPMPDALTHGEFSFQQCGWAIRPGGAELVVFDLATMGRRARFADLTAVLRPAAEALGVPEVELLDDYLTALKDFSWLACDSASAMTELVTCRIFDAVASLHWLTHDVYEPGSDELLEVARRLREDFESVGLGSDLGQGQMSRSRP